MWAARCLAAQVLGRDSRETLLQRLKDGSATATEADKERFLREVFDVAQQVIEKKLDGDPQPPHLNEVVSVLIEIAAMKRRFRCVAAGARSVVPPSPLHCCVRNPLQPPATHGR